MEYCVTSLLVLGPLRLAYLSGVVEYCVQLLFVLQAEDDTDSHVLWSIVFSCCPSYRLKTTLIVVCCGVLCSVVVRLTG